MSILDTAAQLFLDKIGAQGSDLSTSNVMSALQNLLPTDGGEIDQFTSESMGGKLMDAAKGIFDKIR